MTLQFIVEFIVALAIILFFHEFGHFLACRICRIEVEEFGIGLPPRARTLFKAGGTLFTLNWIPFGGFVRPKGENDPAVPGGLAAAKAPVRIFVALSGPVMNLLLAIILYTIAVFALGKPDAARLDTIEIQGVLRDSPAEQAGLQFGDIILSINDEEVHEVQQARQIIYTHLDEPVTIRYQRGEEISEISITPLSSRDPQQGATGITLGTPMSPVSPPEAVWMGIQATYEHIRLLLETVYLIITGQVQSQGIEVSGPVGIGHVYVEIRQEGPVAGVFSLIGILGFFSSITISFALINLLPIPALDGGHIFLALPELIIHRRLPQKTENAMNYISYTLLLLLLVYVTLRDVIKLFG